MNGSKRIVILTPHFPPAKGGVSDYSYNWANKLAESGHSTCVVTASPASASDAYDIFHHSYPWSRDTYKKIERELSEWKADVLIVEYTPLAFGAHTYGIHFYLPLWLRRLRKKTNIKIFSMVHEAHYPVQWNPRGVIIGVPHVAQFIGVCAYSHWLGFSIHKFTEQWGTRLGIAKKCHTLPIFSTIRKFAKLENRVAFLEKYKIPAHGKVMLYFGANHPTNLLGHVAEAKKNVGDSVLVLIGLNENQRQNIPELKDTTDTFALGYLPEEDVSKWLQVADVILCPFMDGVTTRRSTVQAALLHELPIVTTADYNTTNDVPWTEIAWVADHNTATSFAEKTRQALQDQPECRNKAAKGLRHYEENFSLSAIYKRFKEIIE